MLYFKPKSNAIFIGLEKEGNLKGVNTLFIVGEPNVVKVLDKVIEHQVNRIYFGAGFLSRVSKDYIHKVITLIRTNENKLAKNLVAEGSEDLETFSFTLETKFCNARHFLEPATNYFKNKPSLLPDEVILTVTMGDKNFIGEIYFETLRYLKTLDTDTKILLKFDINNTVVITPIEEIEVSGYHEFNNVDRTLYEEN